MKVKITKGYGSAQLEMEIDVSDIKDALFRSSVFSQVDLCGLCKSHEISITGNKDDEGNTYVKRHCEKCGADSNLGTYKGGFGYFWKKWEKWAKKDEDYPLS